MSPVKAHPLRLQPHRDRCLQSHQCPQSHRRPQSRRGARSPTGTAVATHATGPTSVARVTSASATTRDFRASGQRARLDFMTCRESRSACMAHSKPPSRLRCWIQPSTEATNGARCTSYANSGLSFFLRLLEQRRESCALDCVEAQNLRVMVLPQRCRSLSRAVLTSPEGAEAVLSAPTGLNPSDRRRRPGCLGRCVPGTRRRAGRRPR